MLAAALGAAALEGRMDHARRRRRRQQGLRCELSRRSAAAGGGGGGGAGEVARWRGGAAPLGCGRSPSSAVVEDLGQRWQRVGRDVDIPRDPPSPRCSSVLVAAALAALQQRVGRHRAARARRGAELLPLGAEAHLGPQLWRYGDALGGALLHRGDGGGVDGRMGIWGELGLGVSGEKGGMWMEESG